MQKDTIEQLKSMYKNAKKREEEWKTEFPSNSYQCGYAHGAVIAFESIFENLSAFERANMLEED